MAGKTRVVGGSSERDEGRAAKNNTEDSGDFGGRSQGNIACKNCTNGGKKGEAAADGL